MNVNHPFSLNVSQSSHYKMKKNVCILLTTLLMTACAGLMGEEKGRLVFTRLSNEEVNIQETAIDLRKGEEISFCTDMDIEYENELGMGYNIEISRDSV